MTMADSIFGKTIAELRRYSVGERLSIRKANAQVDAINAISQVVGNPQQIVRPRQASGDGTSGVTVRYATVVAIEVPTSRAVRVQFKKWNDDTPPILVNDGESELVECWPDLRAMDFTTFVGTSDIFRVDLIQGGWVISWKINWALAEPNPALPWGQCLA